MNNLTLEELKNKYEEIEIDILDNIPYLTFPEDMSSDFYSEIYNFVKNYDGNIFIKNSVMGQASKDNFLKAEKILNDIVRQVDENWTDKQKVAFIHYQMGKLVSYVPDFNFQGNISQIAQDSRNIWQSIINGQSVCNGVVSIERNLLARIGFSSKELRSESHSFVLAETQEGNIISDPTWDLKNSLYGARPMYFGKTYEQIREIESDLSNAHKLDNPPLNVIEIQDSELREIFYSLGYTNEDRCFKFPIYEMVKQINMDSEKTINDKLQLFFEQFVQQFPSEMTHLTETREILEGCMYELGIEPQNITTKFIYSKRDTKCTNPYLCLLTDGITQPIQILNTDESTFKRMNLEELDKNYKIHDKDTAEAFWKRIISRDSLITQKINEDERVNE